MAESVTTWNVNEHLGSEEMIEAYLQAALEEGRPELLDIARRDAAEARVKLRRDAPC